jgi:hypothetical protein
VEGRAGSNSRRMLSFTSVALLALGVAACGGTSRHTRSMSAQYVPSAKLGGATPAAAAAARRYDMARIRWVHSLHQPHLLNDGDHDEPGDEDHDNNHDTGTSGAAIDPFVDYLPPADNTSYHDEDDMTAVVVGHSASTADTRAIAALVKRYYAAAAAGDGKRACSMMLPRLVRTIPVEYGKFGASYMRGASTCSALEARLFAHLRARITSAIRVTEVRVSNSNAWAFFGSKTTPPEVVSLARNGASWWISEPIGTRLQ